MKMIGGGGKALLVVLALAGCVAPGGEGCTTYGMARADMPPLPDDALGAWVAVTDSAMTRACGR